MARRNKKQGDKPPANELPVEREAAESAVVPQQSPARGRLLLAASIAVVWVFGLAALAFSTANRPMLNRLQIQQADYIITGQIVDVEQGTVSVEKQWKPSGPPREAESIEVRNLAETKARNGSSYVLPLTHVTRDTFEVIRPRLSTERHTAIEQDRPPRIYMATPHAIEQLREMLKH